MQVVIELSPIQRVNSWKRNIKQKRRQRLEVQLQKDVQKEKVRVLFENDEVGFEHAFVSYKDGNKEAVMTYYKFKDGKVVYQETGATKLPK